MNNNIEVIEDNAGGLTIQNTITKDVSYFEHKNMACFSLEEILNDGDMSNWDLSDPAYYIPADQISKHLASGGYRIWTAKQIEEFLAE